MYKKHLAISALAVLSLASAGAAVAGWDEGVAAFKAGNFQLAAQEFQGVVEQQPNVYQGHYMLGQALLKLKRNQDALAHLRKAYDLESGNVGVQMALGTAYVIAGRYADAASVLGKVEASSLPAKQRVQLHQMRAKAYEKTGDERRMRGELKAAADSAPNNGDLWYAYGAAAFNAGDMDGALNALAKAAQLDSGDADKQRTYAQALLRKGRTSRGSAKTSAYQQAAQALGRISSPSYKDLIDRAGAQLGAKQYDAALASLQQAASRNSSDWLPQYYMGQAYTQKQQYATAESELKKALPKASDNKDKLTIWKQLGFVYEKMKRYDDAIAAYSQAGDQAGIQRAQENKETAAYNQEVAAEAEKIRQLQEEQRKLQEELKALPGGKPPVR